MSELTVTTDNVERDLLCLADLDPEERKDFDYVTEDEQFSPRFVRFNDAWYDTGDVQGIVISQEHTRPMGRAMYVEPDHPFAPWNAIVSETFFSGVLFRFVEDGDGDVVCGSYSS